MAVAQDYTALFDLDPQSSNYGKLIIADPSGASATDVAYLQIQRPDGSVKSFGGSPDVSDGVNYEEDLVLSSAGGFLKGAYSITVKHEDTNTPGTFDTFTYVCNFCPVDTLELNFEYNCICAEGTYQINVGHMPDGFEWDSFSTSITPPAIAGVTPANITSSTQTTTLALTYANVQYMARATAEFSFGDDYFTVVQVLSTTRTDKIVCDYNLCALKACIEKEFKNINAAIAQAGGWQRVSPDKAGTWQQIVTYTLLHDMYRSCRNWDKTLEYYNLLKELVSCDCGCSDNQTSEPVAIDASCSSIAGSTVVTANSPLISTPTPSGFLLTLDPDFLATIGISIVEGDDLGITVTSVVSGVTTTYTVALASTSWETITLASGWVQASGSIAPAWRRNGKHIEVKGSLKDDGATVSCFATAVWSTSSQNHPEDPFVYPAIANNDMVGAIAVIQDGATTYGLSFNPNGRYSKDMQVHFHFFVNID